MVKLAHWPGDLYQDENDEQEQEQEANRVDALADVEDALRDIYGPELVSEGCRCPECDNRVMDRLGWDEDCTFVTCDDCGCEYTP